MVVSELATNAIRATGLTDAGATWNDVGDDVAAFHVRMLLFEASIVIEVWDADPAPPLPQHGTGEEEGGRGANDRGGAQRELGLVPGPATRQSRPGRVRHPADRERERANAPPAYREHSQGY